jgi:pseudaminic acid cytidylyltransferase
VVVAIIPARGGSKRIPNKNVKDFLGSPLISYTIRAAKESNVFDRIIVTTDSQDIAATSRDAGAEVPFMRPAELSDDITPTIPVVLHALEWLLGQGIRIDYFCIMYSNPFITAENVVKAFELLKEKKVASVIPVATYAFPVLRSFRIKEQGSIEFAFPEYAAYRSQDLPETCHDVGQFYWCHGPQFLKSEVILQEDTLPFFVSRHLTQDLDTIEDWKMAEKLYQAFMRK